MDKLEFKLLSPYEEGEKWAKDFDCEDATAVAIYITDNELLSLAAEVEKSNATHDCGHMEPLKLYHALKQGGEAVPLACCGDCGEIGCWSIPRQS